MGDHDGEVPCRPSCSALGKKEPVIDYSIDQEAEFFDLGDKSMIFGKVAKGLI
jgi:hypothetical protein